VGSTHFCGIHTTPFGAVGADINFSSPTEEFLSEPGHKRTLPYCSKWVNAQGAKLVTRILVETAGQHAAIPGNDRSMPQPPAMIQEFVPQAIGAVRQLLILSLIHI